ncbi:MAG: AAA family ATPase [Nanoarchaeota archaeon]|nr:AAA family ATPase [Nanoarchaeota archaeon]
MKLVFLYGSPAVGKLTVAKELEKITDYKIFHNHVTLNLVKEYVKKLSRVFRTSEKVRLVMFDSMAKEAEGLIFTYCYSKPEDDWFVKEVINVLKKNKSEVCFVHLKTSKEELMKRVNNNSRKKYNKIRTRKKLDENLKKHKFVEIGFVNNLVIDNTSVKAKDTALKIKKHFKL